MATSSSTPDRDNTPNRDGDQAATKAQGKRPAGTTTDPNAGRTPDTLPKQ